MYASTYICDTSIYMHCYNTLESDWVLGLHFGSVTGSLGEDMLRPDSQKKQ